MSEIKSMFIELQEQQDKKFIILNNALSIIITQNQEIRQSVEVISTQHEELLGRVNNLELENTSYKKRITSLESKIDQLEKVNCSTSIAVRNVPIQDNENKTTLTKIVQDIAIALSIKTPILEPEIRDIYRTKSQAILVHFNTTQRKETLLSCYKTFNKASRETKGQQFDTKLLNLPGTPHTIFISECLSTKAGKIFFAARDLVKNKKAVAAWTSYGKVYVKKEEGAAPVHIADESDLIKITK